MLIQVTRSLSSWFQGIFFRYSQWSRDLSSASHRWDWQVFCLCLAKISRNVIMDGFFSRWWIDQRWAPWPLWTPFFLLRRIFQISRYHGCPNERIWHLKCIHYFQELSTKTRIFMCKRKMFATKKGTSKLYHMVLQSFRGTSKLYGTSKPWILLFTSWYFKTLPSLKLTFSPPENGWLEYLFLSYWVSAYFQGRLRYVSFREGFFRCQGA